MRSTKWRACHDEPAMMPPMLPPGSRASAAPLEATGRFDDSDAPRAAGGPDRSGRLGVVSRSLPACVLAAGLVVLAIRGGSWGAVSRSEGLGVVWWIIGLGALAGAI